MSETGAETDGYECECRETMMGELIEEDTLHNCFSTTESGEEA